MISSVSSGAASWAMQRPDPSQMASKVFSKIDTKSQGFIEKSDLASAFSQISSSDSSTNIDDVFSALDSDGNGKVTESEFGASLKQMASQLDAGFNNMRTSGMGGQGGQGGMGGIGQGGGMPPPPPPGGGQGGSQGVGGDSYSLDELTSMLSETDSSDAGYDLMSTIASNFEAADVNQDGEVSAQEAMSYQQSQEADSTSSTSASTQTDIFKQIMQLMHAYGGAQDSQQNGISDSSSISIIA